jgi:Domain of unknown function (DUF5679)
MDSASVVMLGVFILVVLITLFALVFRLEQLESRLVEVPAAPEPVVHNQRLADNWLVQGYCVKDRRMVEMINPHPITMANGRPATVGVCPHCGTKIYKISRLFGVVEAVSRGRREIA